MNAVTNKLVLSGILFLTTVVSGFALVRAGRPLNSAIFSVHKIIAVAMIVLVVLSVRQLKSSAEGPTYHDVSMMILTGIFFLALIISGSLLSFDLDLPAMVSRIHQVAPVLTLASAATTIFLLSRSMA
jgi:hypothetical protein